MTQIVLLLCSLGLPGGLEPAGSRQTAVEAVESLHPAPPDHAQLPAVIRLTASPISEGFGPGPRTPTFAYGLTTRRTVWDRLHTTNRPRPRLPRVPTDHRSAILRC